MNTQATHTEYSPKLLQAMTTASFITIPQTTIDYRQLHTQLSNYKHTKYIITKLEQHEDKGLHIHVLIQLDRNIRISALHKIIKEQEGEQNGMIDYQKPKHIHKSINYLKKEDTSVENCPFLEYGEPPKQSIRQQDEDKEALLEALRKAEEGNTEEALNDIKQIDPMKYIQYKQQITENLRTENKTREKYDLPSFNVTDVHLNEKQKQVWELLQEKPKARRIIWVSGQYGSGKSFLFNYINSNHRMGLYNAGQSASMDNVVYGYDEEGVIAWDLPRTFDFETMGNSISAVIEKFSDFGQTISSKKYSGKTQHVRGHCLVFSNAPPLQTLAHRDVVHIDLSPEAAKPQVEIKEDRYVPQPETISKEEQSDREEIQKELMDEDLIVTHMRNYSHIKVIAPIVTTTGKFSALRKWIVQLRNPSGQVVSKAFSNEEHAREYMPPGYSIP